MTDSVIVDVVRTPLGKRKGWLREQHPVKLGAHVIQSLIEQTAVRLIVIFGCVS